MRPFSRKNRFTVASSEVSSSPASATTISPSRAVCARRTTTMSPSRIPALIIESPLTRSRNSSPPRASGSGTARYSSTFWSASSGPPAAISPRSGSRWTSAAWAATGFGSRRSSRARGFVGSRLISPARSRFARCAWTVDGEARPTASPISRTVGGYPCASAYSVRNFQISCCRPVSIRISWVGECVERMFGTEGSFPFGRRQLAHRVPDRPHDQQEHHGRSRQEHNRQEALEAAVEQRGDAEPAPRQEVRAPHERLDAEDALELLRLAELARERVPRAREGAGERPADQRRDKEGAAPRGVHEHRLRQVDGRAVRGQADRALHEHEAQGAPHEQPVAAAG